MYLSIYEFIYLYIYVNIFLKGLPVFEKHMLFGTHSMKYKIA